MCCCYRVRKVHQLELFPLLFTMIQTAADPTVFANLRRIELCDTFLGVSAVKLLAEVRFGWFVCDLACALHGGTLWGFHTGWSVGRLVG